MWHLLLALRLLPQLEFSTNALGSRIIVQLLDNTTDDARRLMLTQLLPHVRNLAADMAGNFIIQKLLDICQSECW